MSATISPMSIVIAGASGHVGKMLTKAIAQREDMRLIGALCSPSSSFLGRDVGEVAEIQPQGVEITCEVEPILAREKDQHHNDPRRLGIIDFSSSEAVLSLAPFAAQNHGVYVVGTTALSTESQNAIEKAAKKTTIIQSSNMSIALHVMALLAQEAANRLHHPWDKAIIEKHRRDKKDMPSGTAKMLAQKIFQDGKHPEGRVYPEGSVVSLRSGNIPCEHEIYFEGEGERLLLGHYVRDRKVFANGAIEACLWGQNQPDGLYDMHNYAQALIQN